MKNRRSTVRTTELWAALQTLYSGLPAMCACSDTPTGFHTGFEVSGDVIIRGNIKIKGVIRVLK